MDFFPCTIRRVMETCSYISSLPLAHVILSSFDADTYRKFMVNPPSKVLIPSLDESGIF